MPQRSLRLLLLSFAAGHLACAPDVEGGVLLPPAPDALGALGERGPFGARVERRTLTPDEGGAVDADVFVPFVEDEDAELGPFPPALFVQGGSVPVERYRWFGAHLASRGVVVAAATHPLDLALFAVDHSERALGGLRAANDDLADALFGLVADMPAVVAGHSLGGVVAAKAWGTTRPDEIRHLVLFASYPQDGDRFGDRAGRVVSITGARDAKAALGDVVQGAEAFPDAQVVVVDDMTHYQWTDDATAEEIEGDAEPTEDDAVVRQRAMAFVDALVDDVAERSYYPFDDVAAWPSGTAQP